MSGVIELGACHGDETRLMRSFLEYGAMPGVAIPGPVGWLIIRFSDPGPVATIRIPPSRSGDVARVCGCDRAALRWRAAVIALDDPGGRGVMPRTDGATAASTVLSSTCAGWLRRADGWRGICEMSTRWVGA